MKVIIVGGVAGGATTAARLRRLNEKMEIIMIDRGNHISFANCGLPYYIGDVIKNKKELLLQTPESFNERFNVDVRVRQEVISINSREKKIKIRKLATNEEYEETYDKLVLSPGAEPINPFESLNSNRIKTLRTVEDTIEIKKYINDNDIENVAIIGGGYIGVEMAENLSNYSNLNVTIIQKGTHLINPLDEDIASFVHTELKSRGINLILNNGVEKIEDKEKLEIILSNGKIKADFVILCIGVKPEISLAENAGLELNGKGILVDEYMRTSDKDIYALGDAVIVKNSITNNDMYLALAGPANRQARIVANNIVGKETVYEGVIGSSILKIFDYSLAMTGLNEKICAENNIEYKSIIVSPNSHAGYYPGAEMLTIKALYNKDGKILGSQVWGKEGVDKICDILATAIKMNLTSYDLEKLELCYAPPFSSAKSPVNILGNSIVNELDGLVKTVTWKDVEKLVKEGYEVLDVRTDREYEKGNYKNSIHIPVDDLRNNIDKLSKDKKYLVYCKTGLRSYIACRILTQNGFDVYNITGGYYFYEMINS